MDRNDPKLYEKIGDYLSRVKKVEVDNKEGEEMQQIEDLI